MTTDLIQIREAIDRIVASPSYIPLTGDDFRQLLPGPAGMIHVTGRDIQDTLDKLEDEYGKMPAGRPAGIITFIRSRSLTMGDLQRLAKSIPAAPFRKNGLENSAPEGGGIEVYLFFSRDGRPDSLR